MRKLLFIISILICVFAKAQRPITYTPMTAPGYQFKSLMADSTLHIPQFCGTPFLRDTTIKKSAIGIDTCNNLFYWYDPKTYTWNSVGSGTTIFTGIDSITYSNNSLCQWKDGASTCYQILSPAPNGVDSVTVTDTTLCEWINGVPTCFTMINNVLATGVDSVTVFGTNLCQWIGGVSTCYTIANQLCPTCYDSLRVVDDSTLRFYRQNGDSSQVDFEIIPLDLSNYVTFGDVPSLIDYLNYKVDSIRITEGQYFDTLWQYKNLGTDSSVVGLLYKNLGDGLIRTGGIYLVDSTLSILPDIVYRIGGTVYTVSSQQDFTINSSTDGTCRKDLIYADTNGTLTLLQGVEDASIAVAPDVPEGTIPVTIVDVCGDVIQSIPQPIYLTSGVDSIWRVPGVDSIFFKISGRTHKILDSTGTAPTTILPDGVISGGVVTWLHDYVYNVSEAYYRINNVIYHSPSTDVTLDPSESDDRIDLFVLTTSSTADKVTGTAAATPVEPNYDANTNLRISFAIVYAGTTEPPNSPNQIYFENVEWTTSVSGASINANSTNNPYAGSKDVEGTNVANAAYVNFASPTTVDWTKYNYLTFQIRSKGNFGTTKKLVLRWLSSPSNATGNNVPIGSGSYGFVSTNTSSYQAIAIPLSDFGNIGTASILRITQSNTSGTAGWYLDNIQLQYVPQTVPSNEVVFYGKNATRDSTILILKNGTRFAAFDSTGGGGISGLGNVGSGYRLSTGIAIKTVFPGIDILIDSTTNANALTISADTTNGNTHLATQGDITNALVPYDSAYVQIISLTDTSVVFRRKNFGRDTVKFTGGGGGSGGITELNGLTDGTQLFSTGTSGSDFNIVSSTGVHTFNIPTASASVRGALSSTDWTTFNSKVSGSGTQYQVTYWDPTNSITGNSTLTYQPAKTATTTITSAFNANPALTSHLNGDTLIGLRLTPTFTVGANTGVLKLGMFSDSDIVVNQVRIGKGGGGVSNNTVVGFGALAGNNTNPSGTGGGNTAFGYQAARDNTTGQHNIAIGAQALLQNTTVNDNIAIGASAMGGGVISGNGLNVAIGTRAMLSMTSAEKNIAIGYESLKPCTNCFNNTAVGSTALTAVAGGSHNTGIGTSAGGSINSGVDNTVVGSGAGANFTTTSRNTLMGRNAMANSAGADETAAFGYRSSVATTGDFNSAFGSQSLLANTSGTNNIALGYFAGAYPTTISNQLFINSIDRTNLAGDTTKSIIYGVQNSTATSQWLKLGGTGKVGIGVFPTSTLDASAGSFSTAYVAKTSTYTATDADYTIDCTSGTFTVTLPTAVGITGRMYNIVNSGSGTITIGTTSSQTFVNINTAPTTLTCGAVGAAAITSYTVKSNGANWIVIAKVKDE